MTFDHSPFGKMLERPGREETPLCIEKIMERANNSKLSSKGNIPGPGRLNDPLANFSAAKHEITENKMKKRLLNLSGDFKEGSPHSLSLNPPKRKGELSYF